MKKMLFIAILLVLPTLANGQDPNEVPVEFVKDEQPSIAEKVIDIQQMVDDFLGSKKLHEGINRVGGRDIFIAVGTSVVSAPTNNKGYNSSRITAYEKALLKAKANFTEYMGIEISRQISMDYQEGEFPKPGSETKKPGLFAKGKLLAHAKLDALLKENGVDTGAAAKEKDVKKVLTSDEFRAFTETLAESYISGLQAYKVFEAKESGKKAKISVVAVHSQDLQDMSKVLRGGQVMINSRAPKLPLIEQISSDEAVLMTSFGVQMKVDETGELVLVAYGQGAPATSSDNSMEKAYSKARRSAQGAIRSFAGESVLVSGVLLNAESVTEFEDESELYSNEEAFKESVKASADKLNISGLSTLKKWSGVHPISNRPIAGIVMYWSPNTSKIANDLKNSVEDLQSTKKTNVEDNNMGSQAGESDAGEF